MRQPKGGWGDAPFACSAAEKQPLFCLSQAHPGSGGERGTGRGAGAGAVTRPPTKRRLLRCLGAQPTDSLASQCGVCKPDLILIVLV